MTTKLILTALMAVAAAYLASPYVALYRFQAALGSGDQSSVARMVDWDQVRDGLKQDIVNLIVDEPEPLPRLTMQLAGTTLPPFGASFIKGIVSNAVDKVITPESVTRIAHTGDADPDSSEADPLLPVSLKGAHATTWAFFQSPGTFALWLRPPGRQEALDVVKLRMELTGGTWRITRVWLPPSLLKHHH